MPLCAVTHHLPDEVLTQALAPLHWELEQREADAALITEFPPVPDTTQLAEYLPTLSSLEDCRAALAVWRARLLISPEGITGIEVTVLTHSFWGNAQ